MIADRFLFMRNTGPRLHDLRSSGFHPASIAHGIVMPDFPFEGITHDFKGLMRVEANLPVAHGRGPSPVKQGTRMGNTGTFSGKPKRLDFGDPPSIEFSNLLNIGRIDCDTQGFLFLYPVH